MPSHTINPETANLASSSKQKTGARHAYLSRNGVVIVSAATYRGALERDQNERVRMLIGATDNGDDWQPPTRTPRVITMRSQKTDQMFGYDTFEEGAE